MKKTVRTCGILFLAAMAVLTLVSWKLDELRTPQVLCVEPAPGSVGEQAYESILPLECVQIEDSRCFVYIVEETTSWFYPVAARQVEVLLQDMDNANAAVSGVYRGLQVVRLSSRPLLGQTVPVRVWEATP